jgi:putative acetyltransferase
MIRPLAVADAAVIARIARSARSAVIPGLPDLHTPAEDEAFYRGEIGSSSGAGWVDDTGDMAGFVLWRANQVEHLYVHPDRWRGGIGTRLLDVARAAAGDRELRLWTFQANTVAGAFYRARGFRIIESTDGSGNEEQLPDHLLARSPNQQEHPDEGSADPPRDAATP